MGKGGGDLTIELLFGGGRRVGEGKTCPNSIVHIKVTSKKMGEYSEDL